MIAVTGATGQVGSALVSRLLDMGELVRALTEPGTRLDGREGPQTVEADFGDLRAIRTAAEGADAVFLLTPSQGAAGPLAGDPGPRSCRSGSGQGGLAVGLRYESRHGVENGPLALGRGRVAAGERPPACRRPAPVVHGKPAAPTDLLRTGVLPTYIEDGRPVGMVSAADVGDVAAALLTSVEPKGQVEVPAGLRAITTAEVASTLSNVLGRAVRPRYVSGEAALEELRAMGRPEWHARDTLLICTEASPVTTTAVPDLAGRPARTIAEVAGRRFAHA